METKVVNLTDVKTKETRGRKPKYLKIISDFNGLQTDQCLIVEKPEDKSIQSFKTNIAAALRKNSEIQPFKIRILEDESGIAISKIVQNS